MKTNYFKPNWKAINKAIPNDLLELRKAQKELSNTIQQKIDTYYKAEREKAFNEKVKNLKSLQKDSELFYVGNDSRLKFGSVGLKINDRRTKMQLNFDGHIWNVPYAHLQIELTEQQIKDHKLSVYLTNALNRIIE